MCLCVSGYGICAGTGTCLFELFTGAVMFPGDDNNDMLWRIIEVKGMFPKRLIRRHFQASEELGKEAHFDRDTFRFKRHLLDPVRVACCPSPFPDTHPHTHTHTHIVGRTSLLFFSFYSVCLGSLLSLALSLLILRPSLSSLLCHCVQVSGKPIVKLEGGANHQDSLGATLLSSMTAGDDRCCGPCPLCRRHYAAPQQEGLLVHCLPCV